MLRAIVSPTRSSLRSAEAQKRCLHSDGSSCDRCHAGKRNVVVRPIAEISNRSTARPYTRPKSANACPEHRPSLACLLSLPIRRIKRNLLDNVCRVHLRSRGNRSRTSSGSSLLSELEQRKKRKEKWDTEETLPGERHESNAIFDRSFLVSTHERK